MKPIRIRSMLIVMLLLIFTGCGFALVHQDRYRGHDWDDYGGYSRDYDGGYGYRMDHHDGYYGHRLDHDRGYHGYRMDPDDDYDGHR